MIKLKVPESAHMRIELNKIDSAGLDNAEALRFSLFFLSSSQTNITTMKNFLMLVMLKSDSSALRMVDIMAAQQLGLPERSLPSNSLQWSNKIRTLLQSAEWPIWSHRLSDNHVGDQCWDVHRDNQHQDDLQVGRWSLWAIGGHQQWLSARWRSSFLFFVSFLSHFFVLGGYRQR